ncbi:MULTISPECIES: dicarboxylate/amino acid:cation symporter [unclassified Limnobacter]|uniref:dicarboxylate/amino acid:cation symporter n=1 Tax=unclassified Limnobacter TaxID=2630203 RepID=UPI000C55A751|nr:MULTISPECIES: dicarboxylate/amino acid:cation symporter [unclassified Limnobacter]MAZ08647.1 dicarboxylate/amino acid:cation symporter [Sutterellaceae bacterium]|tara:strand:- start:1037 stop:2374 length:1338 start_codon:yes stop_codon:yes gene_type:complete
MNLTVKVIVGMALGIVVGLAINFSGLNSEGSFVQEFITGGLFHVVGKMFINALNMMVVPLVLFSLICGVCGIGDVKLLGKIGTKSFGFYVMTTAVAIATAILIAGGLGIGEGMNASSDANFTGREAPPLSDVLINIIPTNPINAMAQGEMLSIIFFAILFGISLLLVGRKATKLIELIEILNEAMMKMVTIIMALAPYAVFCLLAKAMAELGVELFTQLIGYVLVLAGVLLFHLLVTLLLVLRVFSGLSPATFLKKIRNVQVFAFSTSSSNATIPVTLRTVTERMGVNNSVASFTVPFGATINMDGTAIMQGVATVFIANMYGVDLGIAGYLTVIMMSVLASIGTAGVPGVGLIMLSMVFSQVGLPLEGIGLILGVDRLLDMLRTAVNVSGDAVVSLIVAKSEGKLDEDVFNNKNLEDSDSGSIHVSSEIGRDFAQAISTAYKGK